jgi:hypothetical protein
MHMEDNLYQELMMFMKRENLSLKLSKVSNEEFWFDGPEKKIAVKILINLQTREILYDVYSVIDRIHLKERKIKDVEQNEYIEEEHRRWKTAQVLEEIWLILDDIMLWCRHHQYTLKETEMI